MMIMDGHTEAAGMAGGDGGDGDGGGFTDEERLRLSKTRRRVANCTTSKRFNLLVVGLVICDVLISLASLTLSPYLVKDVQEAEQVPSRPSSAPSATPSLDEDGHTTGGGLFVLRFNVPKEPLEVLLEVLSYLSIMLLLFFLGEISLQAYVSGLHFFRHLGFIIDATVILASFVFEIFFPTYPGTLLTMFSAWRLVRVFNMTRMVLVKEKRKLQVWEGAVSMTMNSDYSHIEI